MLLVLPSKERYGIFLLLLPIFVEVMRYVPNTTSETVKRLRDWEVTRRLNLFTNKGVPSSRCCVASEI